MFDNTKNMINKMNGVGDVKVDVSELLTQEVAGVIDFALWEETIELQTLFNNGVNTNWQTDPKVDFWIAILDETVEVLNSRHWKWWKNTSKFGEVDWDNIKVEMVDLFHFILSLGIKTKSTDLVFSTLLSGEFGQADLKAKAKEQPDQFFDTVWNDFLLSVQMKSFPMVINQWVELWFRLGYNTLDLFKEYRIKVVLNNIRQEFGYGHKNTYKKMWPDPDDKTKLVEDNVAVWKLAKGFDPKEIKPFEDKLKKYYLMFNV
jgi:dimeric dUTPase (all-alpha-NTP-PPase superfamily)